MNRVFLSGYSQSHKKIMIHKRYFYISNKITSPRRYFIEWLWLYLGRDPIIFKTDHKRVAFLRVATNENWSSDGKRHQHTDWHDVVVFKEKDILYSQDHLKAGDSVIIEGKLKHRFIKGKEGARTKVSEVIVSPGNGAVIGLRLKEINGEGSNNNDEDKK